VIAVVDDEESVRKALVRVLQAARFSARGFDSGTEFLETWHFERPDCLVLDLQMPGLSGTEVQRALRKAGRSFRSSSSRRTTCRVCARSAWVRGRSRTCASHSTFRP